MLLVLALAANSTELLRASWIRLSGIDWGGFAIAVGIHLLSIGAASDRLLRLARALGGRRSRWRLWVDGVQGIALNAALLMGSGELLRIQRLVRSGGVSLARATALIALDRLIGAAVIATTGVVGLVLFAPNLFDFELRSPMPLGIAACAGLIGVSVVVFALRGRAMPISKAISSVVSPLIARPGLLVWTLVVSLFVCGSWVWSVHWLAQSLGLEVPLRALLYAAPLVTVATLLPITVGGIGIREIGYTAFLAPWGVAAADAVSLGIAQYASFLVLGLIGFLSMALPETETHDEGSDDGSSG